MGGIGGLTSVSYLARVGKGTAVNRHVARLIIVIPAAIALAAATLAGTAGAARTGRAPASKAFVDRLYGVTTLSRSDAWAVGLEPSASLILHWDGRAWSKSLAGAGYYLGTGADSATDVWAVGGTNWFSPSAPLIQHWTGSAWTQVPSPDPAGGGVLNAVAAVSPDDAWAVGLIGPGPGVPSPTKPLIEHWNGSSWSITPSPVIASGASLHGVAATSPTDVWAVGWTGPNSSGNNHQTLIEHWNGTAWSRVPSPNATGQYNSLNTVAATSYRNAWAAGLTAFPGHNDTLIEHWDGHAWTVVPSPTPDGDAQVLGLGATRRTDAWAVGMTRGDSCSPNCATFIEHWNGTAWTRVPSPGPTGGGLEALFSVSATGRHNAWAVGTIGYARTLQIHWNGKAWN